MSTWWKMPGGEWWSPDAKGFEPFTQPMHISTEIDDNDMVNGLVGLTMAQIKREPPPDPFAELRDAFMRSQRAAELRAEVERLERRPVPGYPHRSNASLREQLERRSVSHPRR